MSYSRFVVAAAAFVLAACATAPAAAPPGPPSIPDTPLSLGDWRNATEAATLGAFQSEIGARYGAGLPLSAVMADLRSAQFSCAAPARAADGRGDPPAQVCSRNASASGCRHTWQVHLYDANNDARLARTRALYDRSCGSDGLLGGPG